MTATVVASPPCANCKTPDPWPWVEHPIGRLCYACWRRLKCAACGAMGFGKTPDFWVQPRVLAPGEPWVCYQHGTAT